MKILVVGGCGYIGSNTVRVLSELGHQVEVLDNLSTGFENALINGEKLHNMDLAQVKEVFELLQKEKYEAVMHFAASIFVPESMVDPFKFYHNNTANTLNLIQASILAKVPNFIFSSTAAVYGAGDGKPFHEASMRLPENPYGWSKMMSEQMLIDLASRSEMNYGILRYFNVAGADADLQMGQRTPGCTHLIKVISEVANKKRHELEIFGNDYKTKDGTAIRDYVHIEDLASAHVSVLDLLNTQKKSTILNCGYGHGYSVQEVVNAATALKIGEIPTKISPRRAGDVAAIVADNSKILQETNWRPKHDDLSEMIRSAILWEKLVV